MHMSETYTDLALEANNGDLQSLPGVERNQVSADGITTTTIRVQNDQAAAVIGKAKGTYITLEVPGLRKKDAKLQQLVSERFAVQLMEMMNANTTTQLAKVLIVGLGNDHVTPDALGPIVVEHVLVTRHYFEVMAIEQNANIRMVSAIAPGVLGTTGIETSEIVKGIVEKTRPDIVLAIDSLASRALDRINTTIQMTDTGIHPGSGIGNKRRALNRETLGVPVIAIGVPTVVYASTIVNHSIALLSQHLCDRISENQQTLGIFDSMTEENRLTLVKEVLEPLGHDLLVTPKDIDQFIDDTGQLIANGINIALHQSNDGEHSQLVSH